MAIIGKNIIENLTTAMYENLLIIYREYVQNAADSIDAAIRKKILIKDEAEIHIDIDKIAKKITICDNGVGIPANNFKRIMGSIADSTKDRTEDKGFRGIGRLGGISSCSKLIFSCSALGETIESVCEWDAALVREILNDKNQHPSATELVDQVIHYSQNTANKDQHFFKVELIGIETTASELLDDKKVSQYLECVAPLPYKKGFYLSDKIHRFAKENHFVIDEYKVFLNGELLYKPYNLRFFEKKQNNNYSSYDELSDIDTKIFKSSSGEVLAWMWFGISRFEKQIPKNDYNIMRGIRLRKGNIQIGDENTFNKLYKESRGALYFVGEVFAVSPDLIPNARRDYFNINETCRELENTLLPVFGDRFYMLYHRANDYKKACQKVIEYQKQEDIFIQKSNEGNFIDESHKHQEEEQLKKKHEESEKAKHLLEVRESNDSQDDVLIRIYKEISKEYDPAVDKEKKKAISISPKAKKNYITQSLTKYDKKERKLISHIYSIIRNMLPEDQSSYIISKIQEELSK